MVVITCNAPVGVGGLGRALADTISAVRATGRNFHVYAGGVGTGRDMSRSVTCMVPRLPKVLARVPPIRFNPGHQQYLDFDCFDRMVSGQLTVAPEATVAFCGQALHTFRRARALGCPRLDLVAPTGHLAHVWRQHALARRRYPIERDWLSRAHRDRGIAEYELADVIHVVSEYAWDTFVREGVPAAKLSLLPVSVDERFRPGHPEPDGLFRIVYTGALSVVKGIPLLLDTFASFDCHGVELTLVGSTGTRGMRRFMERRCAADARIRLAPGDPLPHLQRAAVYVHPSYQDGFAYAVAEALACGIPAIVTEDTGAKELIAPGNNGEIVPTGNIDALLDALRRRYEQFRAQRALGQKVPCAS